jgi:hypothetical protein
MGDLCELAYMTGAALVHKLLQNEPSRISRTVLKSTAVLQHMINYFRAYLLSMITTSKTKGSLGSGVMWLLAVSGLDGLPLGTVTRHLGCYT